MSGNGKGFATRPLENEEYKQIMDLLKNGFKYTKDGKEKKFRPNMQIALILGLQANIGLRIGDTLNLKLSDFKNNRIDIIEQKTKRRQYRKVNVGTINEIMNYAIQNNIKANEKLFNLTTRAVQKQLKIVCDYLEFDHISTHSFRKYYATTKYKESNNNICEVQKLLNHKSIGTTQDYIGVSQEEIDEASESHFVGF
jgi:integrase